jgi:transposase
MKNPAATRQTEKTQIEQLSQAELVEMVLGLQKIIEELQEKLAIATGKSRTTSQTSSKPPSTDLIQKSEKPTVKPEADQKKKPGGQPDPDGKNPKRVWTSRQNRN